MITLPESLQRKYAELTPEETKRLIWQQAEDGTSCQACVCNTSHLIRPAPRERPCGQVGCILASCRKSLNR